MEHDEIEMTRLLNLAAAGGPVASDEVVPRVCRELRQLAAWNLRRLPRGETLQPTALVHEAYLKMVDQKRADWQSRAHFRAVAAQVMRRLLVDHERRRARRKRGGDQRKIVLDDVLQELLGIDISKQQQSSDWGSPDLSAAQLDYAASDVLYLHQLRDELNTRLAREGRTDLAQKCFDFLPTRVRLDLEGWPEVDIFAH